MRGHVVFVDESGDLGLSSRSTRSITICAVATGSCRRLDGIPGRVRRRLHVKKQKEKSELKFSNSSSRIRERALDSLATMEDVRVIALTVHKTGFVKDIEADPDGFYMSLCGTLVGHLPLASAAPGRVNLVFDARRGPRSRGLEFDGQMAARTRDGYREMGLMEPEVAVSRFDSLNSGGLQMADFAAGAIHRWHESGDDRYRKMIGSRIVLDRLYDDE
ncbi:MAG: DUF3800 domain-containing protein [Thermoplasmata archaeon]|nr:DUF3800 domain-containing protein [Thermoplasmata archaeon]